ncbi:hypothetical protein KUTeg_014199 [Tegillarca granosa]|uniref:RING-type domain-containing protein n=1 Tax=Tegillarca granosa TaxID=220873 RepID=A0ABQ9EZP4_TEGGR|nr:hypothetical protein KUTeg_014199 [Tegillarca granosa]
MSASSASEEREDEVPSKRQKIDSSASINSHEFYMNDTEEYSLDEDISGILSQDTQPGYSNQGEGDHENIKPPTPPIDNSSACEKECRDSNKPYMVKKTDSIYKDAELISSILSGVDVTDVYEKIKARRKDPNRVDVIMNEILENSNSKPDKVINTIERQPDEQKNQEVSLLEDFAKVIDKLVTNLTSLPVTANEINQMLNQYQYRRDRIDYVVSLILAKHYHRKTGGKIDKSDEIMKDFMLVSSKLTDEIESNKISPDEIFWLLDSKKNESDRVNQAVNHFKTQITGKLVKTDSFPTDPALQNDLIYRDMRIVSKVIPEKDPNEIYAYLEAHHDRKDRLRIVIEELLKLGSEQPNSLSVESRSESLPDLDLQVSKVSYGIKDEIDDLLEIFPDCDPYYLYEELEKRSHDKERVKNIAVDMFDNKKYPKAKDRVTEIEKANSKRKLQNLQLTIEEFLSKFPDPKTSFSTNSKKFKFIHRHTDEDFPDEPDEFFFHEKYYYDFKVEINDFLKEKQKLRDLKLEEARKNGELLECECCFDNECLGEDILSCNDGHLFCKECIRRSSAVVIGQGKCEFPCLTGTCGYLFSLAVLQNVLSANMFSIVLRRMQEEEIKQANLEDLVSCPFCSFSTIMSNPDDKVFKCLNQDCLKDSCRLCKEPNHIPLRCNEVEKQGETSMRTFIETKLSEAMLRTCHKCNKRFYKEHGCNKMTCVCGASMCYVCREPDIDYNHFNAENKRCTEMNNMRELHWDEMLKAAQEAKELYLKDHPEASDIVMKYDPEKHIEEYKQGHRFLDNDDGDDDYDEEEDDDF